MSRARERERGEGKWRRGALGLAHALTHIFTRASKHTLTLTGYCRGGQTPAPRLTCSRPTSCNGGRAAIAPGGPAWCNANQARSG